MHFISKLPSGCGYFLDRVSYIKKKTIIDIKQKYLQCYIFSVEEGSYLPSNRNSPQSERIENAPLAVLISTEQVLLVLGSSGKYMDRFGAFLSTVLFAHPPTSPT